MITGIIVALPEELGTLTSVKLSRGDSTYITENVLVALSGAGPDNATETARRLISQGAECLISWGCAAALTDELKPGDLTIPGKLVDDKGQSFDIRSRWLDELQQALIPLHPKTAAVLAGSEKLIATTTAKRKLHHDTGASVLDMESLAIARIAQAHSVLFAAVRAVADPADMNLPQAISHALNPNGEVEILKLLKYLIKHPGELPGLIQLGLYFHASKKTLKRAATVCLSSCLN
ncbi:MAG: hypothetical protein Kow0065_11190 [Methylomicrobium sp.]